MVVLGRITAPYGVAGWVRVHAFGDDPLSWRAMPQWWIADTPDAPDAAWTPIKQTGCRIHGDSFVACFESVTDRDGSEALQGKFIGAPRESLPKTGKDEYYWMDLIGLPVSNMQAEALGNVVEIIESGAHAVLHLRDAGGLERLLPFTVQVVKKVRLGVGIEVDWGSDWGLD